MALSPPPSPLPRPNERRLPAGLKLHRVHLSRHAGTSFNPCAGAPTRFAPIADLSGSCVPSLYAGSIVEAAIFETLFHDIPMTARRKTWPKSALGLRSHSELELGRDLRVAELRKPDLGRWNVSRDDLIGSSPTSYPQTALWAEALHHAFADFEGMIWTSNRCDPEDALILFGDRVPEADLTLVRTRGGGDAGFEADVQKAAARAGITITL